MYSRELNVESAVTDNGDQQVTDAVECLKRLQGLVESSVYIAARADDILRPVMCSDETEKTLETSPKPPYPTTVPFLLELYSCSDALERNLRRINAYLSRVGF